MDVNGSRILVTGGAGLIGSATIDLLLQAWKPEKIVIFDNLVRGSLSNIRAALADPRVTLIRGDIRNLDKVRRAMAGMDAVIHLAALRITACAAEPVEAMEVMCNGSFNVVHAASEAGVKKIVAASSASVYGLADSFPTSEQHHPYNNQTWYGAGKVMLEGLLRSYYAMHRLPYVAMRYFNVYGPRMDLHGRYTEVLVRWINAIEAGQPPLIMGDGTQTMDFVYIDDVARANVMALASDVEDQVFNIASGSETSLNVLVRVLLKAMGSGMSPQYGPERAVNPVYRRLADTTKARTQLGFATQVGLQEGLERLVDWWHSSKDRQLVGAA